MYEEIKDKLKDKNLNQFLNPFSNQKLGRKYFFLIEALNSNKNKSWLCWMCHDKFFHQLDIMPVFSHILSHASLIHAKKDFNRSVKIFENEWEYLEKSFDYAMNKKI